MPTRTADSRRDKNRRMAPGVQVLLRTVEYKQQQNADTAMIHAARAMRDNNADQ